MKDHFLNKFTPVLEQAALSLEEWAAHAKTDIQKITTQQLDAMRKTVEANVKTLGDDMAALDAPKKELRKFTA